MTDTRSITLPSVSDLVAAFVADAGKAGEEWVRDYLAADKGTKARMRTLRTNAFKEAFRTKRYEAAEALDAIESKMSVSTEKPEIDPNVEIGTLAANYLKAALVLLSGGALISGNADNVTEIRALADDSDIEAIADIAAKMDLPVITPETVERLITVRIGRKSREHDIADMIRKSVENVPNGTFLKVSGIRAKMAETYPDKGISAGWDGRISAALFVNNGGEGVEGLVSVRTDANGAEGRNTHLFRHFGHNGAIVGDLDDLPESVKKAVTDMGYNLDGSPIADETDSTD